MRRLMFAAVLASAAVGEFNAQPPPSSAVTAFVGVSVIPMDRDTVTRDQTVLVRDGRITAIGPAAGVRVPDGAVRVDGRGKYLMPALAEMHAHVPGGDAPDAAIERVLLLWVANGIGTIRGMLGQPRHLPLRERLARGEIFGPRLYTSGPSFNGNSATSAAAAAQMVKDQKAAGYDLLKIHPGVPRDAFDAMAATADALRIRFAGHVPAEVGLDRALEAKYATIDHLDGYLEALAGPDAPPSQTFGLNLVSRLDESKIAAVVANTKAAGTAMVPTEILLENWVGPDDPQAMAAWPEMKYARPEQIQAWTEQKRKLTAGASLADRGKMIAVRRRLINALHDAGVPFLLGSDSPQTWNVPGFSIHRELGTLVASGLTPYEALVTGTRNVAVYFGTEQETGTVAAGKRADLVLLDANPLADITNSSKIAGVMIGGRWMTREEIRRRLDGGT